MRKLIAGVVMAASVASVGLIGSASVASADDDCETHAVYNLVEDYSFVTDDGRIISVGHIEITYERVCVSDILPLEGDE
jgi:hypothetical protein